MEEYCWQKNIDEFFPADNVCRVGSGFVHDYELKDPSSILVVDEDFLNKVFNNERSTMRYEVGTL